MVFGRWCLRCGSPVLWSLSFCSCFCLRFNNLAEALQSSFMLSMYLRSNIFACSIFQNCWHYWFTHLGFLTSKIPRIPIKESIQSTQNGAIAIDGAIGQSHGLAGPDQQDERVPSEVWNIAALFVIMHIHYLLICKYVIWNKNT